MLFRMKTARAMVPFVCLLMILGAAEAQQISTPVVITITDPSGAKVPTAQIRVVPAPDPEPKMVTDDKGQLALNLKPGSYALFARFQGFKPLVLHFDVRPQSEVQTITGVLEIGMFSGPTLVSPATSKDDLVFSAYPYHEPAAFSVAQIKSMPQTKVAVHNPHTTADETYSGVRLADLLTKVNAPIGKELHGESLTIYIMATRIGWLSRHSVPGGSRP